MSRDVACLLLRKKTPNQFFSGIRVTSPWLQSYMCPDPPGGAVNNQVHVIKALVARDGKHPGLFGINVGQTCQKG